MVRWTLVRRDDVGDVSSRGDQRRSRPQLGGTIVIIVIIIVIVVIVVVR